MKGKIILGLGTIGVTASTLSMVACGNTNKSKKDNLDSDTAKSTKEINKYPELNQKTYEEWSRSNILTSFYRKEGRKHFSKDLSLLKNKDKKIYWYDHWFLWTPNSVDRFVVDYYEIYDYAHSKNPNLYPYLND